MRGSLFAVLAIIAIAIAIGGWLLARHLDIRVATSPATTLPRFTPQTPASEPTILATNQSKSPRDKVPLSTLPYDEWKYDHAPNLLPLVDATQGKDDVTSLTIRARAFDECMRLAIVPGFYSRVDIDAADGFYGDNGALVKMYAAEYLQRCADVAHVYKARSRARLDAIRAAADAGSPWARATLFRTASRDMPVADADAELRDLLASHDPEAIGALGFSMTEPRADSDYASLADPRLGEFAWSLASCALGRDCSRDGELTRQLCLNGICGNAATYEDLLQQYVMPPADFRKTLDLEAAILQAVRDANGSASK